MHSQNVSRLNLAARTLQNLDIRQNGLLCRDRMFGGEGFTTFLLLPRQPVKDHVSAYFARPGAAAY